MRGRAVLLVATTTVAGCIWQGRVSNPFETEGAGIIRVVVQNHNFHQATVKALGRAQRRIGIVAGNSSKTFSLPWPTADNLVLEIDLLAGSTFRTNSISLEPGESATLYIEQVISLSTLVRDVGSDGG